MRHRKTVEKLGRTASHRKALLANLSIALFEKKHIITTEAKAKAARRFSERLITLAKKDSVHARRLVYSRLGQKHIVKMLFDEIAPQYANRNGGYTRVIKLGQRAGDGARMAILELVGYEMASKKKKEKEAKAESEEGKKKKAKGKAVQETTEEAVAQEPAPEEKPEKNKAASKKKVNPKEDKKKETKKPEKQGKSSQKEKKK